MGGDPWGDINGVNGFTIGDAIFVAMVWSQQAEFNFYNTTKVNVSPSRRLVDSEGYLYHGGIRGVKHDHARRIDLIVSLRSFKSTYPFENSTIPFSAISVSFTHSLESVEILVDGMDAYIDGNARRYLSLTKVQPDPPQFLPGH